MNKIRYTALVLLILCAYPLSEGWCDGVKWIEFGPEGGGFQQTIAFDPVLPGRVYLASDTTGVFVSDSGGDEWRWSGYGAGLQKIGVAVDPGNPNLLYAVGTDGIYRSTDRAGNWLMVYSEGNGYRGINNASFGASGHNAKKSIFGYPGVAISISQNGTVYVYTRLGDLIISRDNGGTWERISIGGRSEVSDVIPVDNDRVVAALLNDGIYLSYDQGRNWKKVYSSDGSKVFGMAIHPVSNNLYAVVGKETVMHYFPKYSKKNFSADLIESSDGGETWQIKHSFNKLSIKRGKRKIDVSKDGTLIILSLEGPIRSINGGKSWTLSKVIGEKNDGFIYYKLKGATSSPHAIFADPFNPKRWYMTDMNAVYRSDDDGDTWYYKVKGLRDGVFWRVRVNPADNNAIIASQIDHGMIITTDRGESWREIIIDGPHELCDEIRFSPNDDQYNTLYALCALVDTYIVKSHDAGESWTVIKRWKNKKRSYMGRLALVQGEKVPVMFVGEPGVGIWRSVDEGKSWKLINEGIPQPEKIVEVRVIESDKRGNIYAGIVSKLKSASGLFKSTDMGKSWFAINRGLRSRDIRRNSLEIDPNNPDVLWLGVSRDVYRSTNGGIDWEMRIAGMFCSSVLIDPENSDIVYVAAFNGGGVVEQYTSGIYKSVDGGNFFFNISGNLRKMIGSSYRVYNLEYGWDRGRICAASFAGSLICTDD